MNPYSIAPLLAGTLALLLGIFVLFNNRTDRLNRLFCGICVAIFVWLGAFSLGYSISDPRLALSVFRSAYLGVCLIPVLSLNLHLEFVGLYRPKLMAALYVLSVFFLLTVPTPLFFSTVKQYYWGYYPQAGPLYPFFIFYFGSLLVSSSSILTCQILKSTVRGQYDNFRFQQLRFLALAFIIAYGGCVDFVAKFGIEFYPFGYANIVLFVIILSYAMLRHRLLDLQTMMQIFQQNKLATLGLLSAGLNHEIRNPLFVIRGYAESYIENYKSGLFKDPITAEEKSREILFKTIEQADRAVDIIYRFSSFAKISQDGQMKREVDVGGCLKNVLEFLNHEFENKKIQIEKYLADGMKIYANQREIEEIIFNIVLNASQAMRGEGKISITSLRKADHCLILIRDTGPGIPKHLHKKIFEPFYSGRSGGTGLGLFICQFLAEQNGGTVQLNSKMGEGSVFLLEFPVYQVSEGKGMEEYASIADNS